MVREQRPRADDQRPCFRQAREAGDEVRPVDRIPKDGPALQAAHHDMVEGLRGVQARLTGHSESEGTRKRIKKQRPARK